MSDQEKQQWREWFERNPEWVKPLAAFINAKHGELMAKANVSRMYWHDLINALMPAYLKSQLKGRKQ